MICYKQSCVGQPRKTKILENFLKELLNKWIAHRNNAAIEGFANKYQALLEDGVIITASFHDFPRTKFLLVSHIKKLAFTIFVFLG